MPMLFYFMLGAGQSAEPPARLPQENQETHKPEQNPGHLSTSAFRSASLRFPTTTTIYGTGCLQSYVPRGLLSFVVVHRILFHSSCAIWSLIGGGVLRRV